MERTISFVQGVATMALLAAIVTGYWALGAAAAVAQSPCDDDPYCHNLRADDLWVAAGSCGAPRCNTRIQVCCLAPIIVE